MGWLLDTNVISHMSPWEKKPNPQMVDWIAHHQSELWLSGITLFEISQGIHKLVRRGATEKARTLKFWLDALLIAYEPRVIVPDIPILVKAGQLAQKAIAAGVDPGIEDAVVAATGDLRNLLVLTRNIRHIAPMGVPCHDPYDKLPPNGYVQ